MIERRLAGVLRRALSPRLWHPMRAVATAFVTPLRFSRATGHWRSSMTTTAMTAGGSPLPWYTYPAIDFLSQRDFTGKRVLEFGGGQSTLWWAQRAETVLTIEEDETWHRSLKQSVPANVDLRFVPADRETRKVGEIQAILNAQNNLPFDVIVVDGHLRREAAALAFSFLAAGGALILDNAEGYGFYDVIRTRDCRHVDFYGFAPGVSRRHCTSLVYVGDCFLLNPEVPIVDIETH